MPLRPALKTIHPRGPKPREVRRLSCPNCAHTFDVSARAISVRCPACTSPLEIKDVALRDRLEGQISTMGRVELTPPSEMIGQLVCGQFTNAGRFDGTLVAYGLIELRDASLTTGHLVGKSLHIDGGATVRAHAHIAPRPKIQWALANTAAHAAEKLARQLPLPKPRALPR
jgi:uncharacterized OB-fold protein